MRRLISMDNSAWWLTFLPEVPATSTLDVAVASNIPYDFFMYVGHCKLENYKFLANWPVYIYFSCKKYTEIPSARRVSLMYESRKHYLTKPSCQGTVPLLKVGIQQGSSKVLVIV